MTIRKLILATTILTATTAYAFAQSGPAPANTIDNNTKAAPAHGPTDNSAASASGNDETRGARTGMRGGATTGLSGDGAVVREGPGANTNETYKRIASPGSQSPATGIEKEK